MRALFVLCPLIGVLVACAVPQPVPATAVPAVQTAAATPQEPEVICHRETPVGSSIPHNVCEKVPTNPQLQQMQADMAAVVRQKASAAAHD